MLTRWAFLFLLQLLAARALMAEGFEFGPVREQARRLAEQPFQDLTNAVPHVLQAMSYAEYQGIQFRREKALWADEGLPFQVEFFLPGSIHRQTVTIHEVAGQAIRPIRCSADQFSFGTNRLTLPNDLGYAGFRIVYPGQQFGELAVFLDASYFRMIGRGQTFGASARGLALNTVLLGNEEFPSFRQFWLRKPQKHDTNVTLWALLDSPSVAAAFEFVITPGTLTSAQTKAAFFARRTVQKFGIAPVTSMFLYDENNHPPNIDFRPEVHDSDGLLMETGQGKTLWRPLEGGKMMRVNAYQDNNPRGFGLLQRERDFEQFQDLIGRFELRPSVWVKALGQWGPGAVELIQLPSNIEYTDNVVAFWVPATPPQPGKPLDVAYQIDWLTNNVANSSLGYVRATRLGAVNTAPAEAPNQRFVIDFDGPTMQKFSASEQLDAEVTYSPGARLVADTVAKNPVNGTWRLVIEIAAPGTAFDVQALLKRRGQAVTETWTYTWQP